MRKIIGEVKLPFHGVTLGVRRVCSVHDDDVLLGEDLNTRRTEVGGEAHNELYAETFSGGHNREIVRMRTGTDCSVDNLPEYLNRARKHLDSLLSEIMQKPPEKYPTDYVQVIENRPGKSAEQAMRQFAFAFAVNPSTKIEILTKA